MTCIRSYADRAIRIEANLPNAALERLAIELAALRQRNDRLLVPGASGSAANCRYPLNDFCYLRQMGSRSDRPAAAV